MEQELKIFFTGYAEKLAKGDIKGISNLYAKRFMMESPESSRGLKNGWLFRFFLKQSFGFYQKRDLTKLVMNRLSVQLLGDTYVLADIEWVVKKRDDTEAVRYDVTYILSRASSLKIVFFISHNEQQRMKQKGLL
jgi:hypothetical protein